MKTITTLSRKVPALFALLIISQQVFAGSGVGTITHEPASTGVPLLGGAGLMVLSALLGLVALRFLKERGRGGSFLIVAAMAGAVASAGGGLKLINDAEALSGITLTKFSGGTITIPSTGFNTVINGAGSAQEITRISLNEGCELQPIMVRALINGGYNGGNGGMSRGACDDKPRTVLQSGDSCDISVCCDVLNGGNGGANGGCFDEE